MKYFDNRQNNTGQSEEQLEDIFKSLADSFSYKWLKTPGSHPLQQLWARADVFATNELYSFGDALVRIKAIDPKWVSDQVKLIKSDSVNSRNGAMFEINAISMLASAKQEVAPAKGNNPGFDAVLKLTPDKTMRVSLKNYGDSAHFKSFHGYASIFEKQVLEILKKNRIADVQILIEFFGGFPEKSDWQLLNDHTEILIQLYEERGYQDMIIDAKWRVILSPLHDEVQPYHPALQSYQVIITAPYHKNEHKNLLDKLDEAAANLVKHSKVENAEICNIVFIHLPESAAIMTCKQWAEDYLKNYPEKPLTGIILYQPVIATDTAKDVNFIHHGFQFAFNEAKFETWNSEGINLEFTLPVGIINSEPSINSIVIEAEGKKETITFTDKYLFQRGNLYLESIKDADGNTVGNIRRLASGVFSHSVFQLSPEEPAMIISARFLPVDKLLIL